MLLPEILSFAYFILKKFLKKIFPFLEKFLILITTICMVKFAINHYILYVCVVIEKNEFDQFMSLNL